jgi:hypothetical protein
MATNRAGAPDGTGCSEGERTLGQESAKAVFRDLNRNLVDLLGPCPATVDGSWVVVRPSGPGVWTAALPDLTVEQALRMSTLVVGLGAQRGGPAQSVPTPPVAVHAFDTYFHVGATEPSSRVHVQVPR